MQDDSSDARYTTSAAFSCAFVGEEASDLRTEVAVLAGANFTDHAKSFHAAIRSVQVTGAREWLAITFADSNGAGRDLPVR